MHKLYLVSAVLFSFLLISCVSTNVYEKQETIVFQDDEVLTIENTFIKDNKVKSKDKVNVTSTIDLPESENLRVEKTDEKVTVESKTNYVFVAYTIFGKPFVILGCANWELLKCCGYALVNFIGGYNAMTGRNVFWMMPDVKGSLKKAKYYKEQNAVKVYPEYHKKYTNNKITVSKITYTAETFSTNENEMQVSSTEEYEYDNTLSVQLSALSDANQTFGIFGAIGSVITVPIAVGTWICGAIYGIGSRFN